MSCAYDLHWKSVPMGAIEPDPYTSWYCPYLGTGVYIFVMATTGDAYVGYYVGKSDDIGRRWYEHVHGNGKRDCDGQGISWFKNPVGFSIPSNVVDFLADPVGVLNSSETGLVKGRGDKKSRETVKAMLDRTWFCWAEVTCHPGHRIEDVEVVVQEALKQHAGIKVKEEIGDARFRRDPTSALTIRNNFGRPFLGNVLPPTFTYP